MIPLESPVPEIGTPGSESGGRKRAHGPRIAARCESAGSATDALPATRLPSTLPRRPSLRSESSYGPCGPGWTGASRPSTASRRMRDEQSTGGLGRARSRGAVEAANAGAFGLRRHRTTAIPHPHLFQETQFVLRDVQPAPVFRRVAELDATNQFPCPGRLEHFVEGSLGVRVEVVAHQGDVRTRSRHAGDGSSWPPSAGGFPGPTAPAARPCTRRDNSDRRVSDTDPRPVPCAPRTRHRPAAGSPSTRSSAASSRFF